MEQSTVIHILYYVLPVLFAIGFFIIIQEYVKSSRPKERIIDAIDTKLKVIIKTNKRTIRFSKGNKQWQERIAGIGHLAGIEGNFKLHELIGKEVILS